MKDRKRSELLTGVEQASEPAPNKAQTSVALRDHYCVADFFVVRSPLYPFQRLVNWAARNPVATAANPAAARWSDRRASLLSALRAAFTNPCLREATFFASIDLEQLISLSQGRRELPENLVRTLTRYFMRIAGRETPFGSFAGVSLGRVAQTSCLELGELASHCRVTSVSARYVDQLLLELGARVDVRDGVRHTACPTLVHIRGKYRFARSAPSSSREHSKDGIIEIQATPAMERVVLEAGAGATLEQLARSLKERGHAYQQALEFVRTLCDKGLLVPSWLPSATGEHPLTQALARLAEVPRFEPEARLLSSAKSALARADAAGVGSGGLAYRAVVEKLPLVKDAEIRHVLQSQLVKPSPQLAIGERLAGQFLVAANLLQRVASVPGSDELEEFRSRFVDRYESRWVPLAEALDVDLGVGFGSSDTLAPDALLADTIASSPEPRDPYFDSFDRARSSIAHRALARGKTVHELEHSDLALFPAAPVADMPESFTVLARVAADAAGRLLVVAPTIWNSPASLLGRFCAADHQLDEALRRHVASEQQLAGAALLADVAYLPGDPGANIVIRPVLRGYEIPYRGKSGAPPERQIPISDLYVTVESKRVLLYSQRHRKQVKVRIANAHNVHHSNHLPIYRFLGALEAADFPLARGWSWGALETSPFLPRIVHGLTVLSLACWRLSRRELEPIVALSGEQAFDSFQQLRAARGLPRWLSRTDGDQRLPVDLDNELSVEELLYEARQRQELVLHELLPGPDELVLRAPEGAFSGEFAVPFLRRHATTRALGTEPGNAVLDVAERRHSSGSEWLYVKIYAPRSALESILRSIKRDVVDPSLSSALKLWFYLPFQDPEHHLRVRFHGSPSKLEQVVLRRLRRVLRPLLEDGTIWRFQLDTYDQELERYGGKVGIKLAEKVFCADSEAVCQLLDLSGHDHELRWQFAVLGIDRLLRDHGFDLTKRNVLARAAHEAYALEIGANAATRKAVGAKYRVHAARLSEILWQPAEQASGVWRQARAILAARSVRVKPVLVQLQRAILAGKVEAQTDGLAHSFAHMHAIRLLGPTARSFELILYDFLRRQYTARAAQNRGDDAPSIRPN